MHMHAYMHACMDACMYAYAYAHAHACICICMHACMHAWMHAACIPNEPLVSPRCMYAYAHAHACICICICMHACTHACMHACAVRAYAICQSWFVVGPHLHPLHAWDKQGQHRNWAGPNGRRPIAATMAMATPQQWSLASGWHHDCDHSHNSFMLWDTA